MRNADNLPVMSFNHEVPFCEVEKEEIKTKLEKVLLKERISYYIQWPKTGYFSSTKKTTCIFYINDLQREGAEAALKLLEESVVANVKILTCG